MLSEVSDCEPVANWAALAQPALPFVTVGVAGVGGCTPVPGLVAAPAPAVPPPQALNTSDDKKTARVMYKIRPFFMFKLSPMRHCLRRFCFTYRRADRAAGIRCAPTTGRRG